VRVANFAAIAVEEWASRSPCGSHRQGKVESAMAAEVSVSHGGAQEEPSRRDFLFIATGAMAAVGAAATLWPMIDQMNPDASTLAAAGPVDVDLKQLEAGQQIVVLWAARPVFVVNRTKAALDGLRDPKLLTRLSDPDSQVAQQPSYADNWSRSIKPEILVLVGICTHLGCIPKYFPNPNASDPAPAWPGGFFCPCHGSKYDLAGRVFTGVPAPYNLPVPPYHFPDDKTLRVGENPSGQTFDFNSVVQV
jgi:ubiquinol-cytochrome c reductase iron-sulfur subunit